MEKKYNWEGKDNTDLLAARQQHLTRYTVNTVPSAAAVAVFFSVKNRCFSTGNQHDVSCKTGGMSTDIYNMVRLHTNETLSRGEAIGYI